MTYREIFDECEGKYRIQNKKTFGQFLEEFKKRGGIDWRIVAKEDKIDFSDYTNIFWSLHTYLFNVPEFASYIPLFYQLLEEYHYNFSDDYLSFIRLIGQHSIHFMPNNVRNFVIKAPYIDKLSDNDGKITVYSEKLGNVTFSSTRKYFLGNYFINLLLESNKVVGECHNISWKLMDYMPGSTLVTSLIPNSFLGTAYHSVIRTKDNLIVDAANSCVLEEKDYHAFLHDEIICETKDTNRNVALIEAGSIEGSNMANAMVLALHEQKKKL